MEFNQHNHDAGAVNNITIGPRRKKNSWEFELPPGCVEQDFTGAAHDALLTMVDSWQADSLKRALLAAIRRHGATHNQRVLLENARDEVFREQQ